MQQNETESSGRVGRSVRSGPATFQVRASGTRNPGSAIRPPEPPEVVGDTRPRRTNLYAAPSRRHPARAVDTCHEVDCRTTSRQRPKSLAGFSFPSPLGQLTALVEQCRHSPAPAPRCCRSYQRCPLTPQSVRMMGHTSNCPRSARATTEAQNTFRVTPRCDHGLYGHTANTSASLPSAVNSS